MAGRTRTLAALVAAAVAALAVAATVHADGVPYAVELPDGALYAFDGSEYLHVPDADTAYSLGIGWCDSDWCGVVHYDSTDELPAPVGGDWPSGAGGGGGDPCAGTAPSLVETPDGAVYQLDDDGAYHWIPDPDTAFALGVTWGGSDWDGVTRCNSVPGAVGDPYTSIDAPGGQYGPRQPGAVCRSGIMGGEGTYGVGNLPYYTSNAWYQVSVTFRNLSLGFQGSFFAYGNNIDRHYRGLDQDLHLLPGQQSATFTSYLYISPFHNTSGIPVHLYLSVDSDVVSLEYQACVI